MRLDFALRAAVLFAAFTVPAIAATHTIAVGPNGTFIFSPQTLTIPAGDTVTFQNASGITHNVVSDDGTAFTSPTSGSFTYTTPTPSTGTYGFHCTIHGSPGSGMFGTLTVQATPVTLQSFDVK